MSHQHHCLLTRAIACILCVCLMCPCTVSAASVATPQPCASDYLSSYQTYVCPVQGGEIQVWFNVVGAGFQDELGSLRVVLYESSDNQNFTRVKTFFQENHSNMLGHNVIHHVSYVSYQGTVGKYYKAYVCIWGGSDGNGDSRYVWTSAQQAI